MTKKIDPKDNPTAFIFIKVSEYDPDRHMLPYATVPLLVGDLVGLDPGNPEGAEKAEPLRTAQDFWIYYRIGQVREASPGLVPLFVYAARPDTTSGADDVILVKLKEGLYVNRD